MEPDEPEDELELEDVQSEPEDQDEPEADAGEEAGEDQGDDMVEGAKAEGEGDDADPEPKPKGRGNERLQELWRKEKERNDRVEKELAELRAERQRETAKTDEKTEEERLALMTSDERVDYQLKKLRQENDAFRQQQQFASWDQSDRSAFQAKAATDPRYRKYEPEVERELVEARKRGMNVSREMVLSVLIGQAVLKGKGAVEKKKQEGAGNIRRQQASPGNGRSDQGGRQRGQKSLEDRLADVTF